MNNRNKYTLFIVVLILLGVVLPISGQTYNDPFFGATPLTTSLWIGGDSLYISGNAVIGGDLAITGTVTITGEVTIDSLIVPMWFDLHNGSFDTITGTRADIDDIDCDSINSTVIVGDLTGTADDLDTLLMTAVKAYLPDNYLPLYAKGDSAAYADSAGVAVAAYTADDIDTLVFTAGKNFLVDNYLGKTDQASDVDTTGTDIAAALGDRQPLCTTLTQWCSLVDSVTSGAADSVIILWSVGKPDTLLDVR